MRDKAVKLVTEALQSLNDELGYESLANPTESTVIFGGAEGIDSLSLVRLVVSLEGDSEQAFGRKILLADEKAMSQRNSPYRTVASLADFIVARLNDGSANP